MLKFHPAVGQSEPDDGGSTPPEIELDPHNTEIFLGLHWDPPGASAGSPPADLDALCVLYGSSGEVKEIVHPGHPRSVDGSVVHTGDSRTGAGAWDDERIFVFLRALPAAVAKLEFIVVSAGRHSFDQVWGAACHVSDRMSEVEWVRIDLTSLAGRMTYTVATLRRDSSMWRIEAGVQSIHPPLPVEVQSLLQRNKYNAVHGR